MFRQQVRHNGNAAFKAFTFSHAAPREEIVSTLCKAEHVQELHFIELPEEEPLTQEVWEAILACKTLEVLTLPESIVSKDQLMGLSSLQSLQSLDLRGQQVDAQVLAKLSELPMIRTLKLSISQCDRSTWEALGRVTQLESLTLQLPETPLLLPFCQLLKPLDLCELSVSSLEEEHEVSILRHLATWTSLKSLHLGVLWNDYSSEAWDAIEALELESLGIEMLELDEFVMARLARLHRLKKLSLCFGEACTCQFAFLSSLQNLEELDLSSFEFCAEDAPIPDGILRSLRFLPQLKRLDLSNNSKLCAEHLVHLHDLPALEFVNLEYTGVTPKCLGAHKKAFSAIECKVLEAAREAWPLWRSSVLLLGGTLLAGAGLGTLLLRVLPMFGLELGDELVLGLAYTLCLFLALGAFSWSNKRIPQHLFLH